MVKEIDLKTIQDLETEPLLNKNDSADFEEIEEDVMVNFTTMQPYRAKTSEKIEEELVSQLSAAEEAAEKFETVSGIPLIIPK